MKKFAVIVAGGIGSRMNQTMPKQFLLLNGKPIIYYTISTFLQAYVDVRIIIVIHKDFINEIEEIAKDLDTSRINIIEGGETRFHSVKNGLQLVEKDSIVFVHDAVRCLVSVNLIQRCYEHAIKNGNAIPVVTATDSIRLQNGDSSSSVERNKVKIVQTPQTFKSNMLLQAFEKEYQENFTDEATVVELNGNVIELIEGEFQNIKITRPSDLILASYYLEINNTFL